MPLPKLHPDEPDIDAAIARNLVGRQFPEWAGLKIGHVPSGSTDNVIFRLGDRMALRLPRRPRAADQIAGESRWLPALAPELPLAVPGVHAIGAPDETYPFAWGVYRWLEGGSALDHPPADMHGAARDLARFVTALRHIDAQDAPRPDGTPASRGTPLAGRDDVVRRNLAHLTRDIDVPRVTRLWEAALAAPAWDGPPTWFHGDLQAGNLLTHNGRLSSVIDFGLMGAGDPTTDLAVAWIWLDPGARQTFRTAMHVDAAQWTRGRGWALSIACLELPYYRDTNPAMAQKARVTLDQVLGDRD